MLLTQEITELLHFRSFPPKNNDQFLYKISGHFNGRIGQARFFSNTWALFFFDLKYLGFMQKIRKKRMCRLYKNMSITQGWMER